MPFSINTAFLLFVYMTLLGEVERLLVTALAGIQKLFYFRLFKVGWGVLWQFTLWIIKLVLA